MRQSPCAASSSAENFLTNLEARDRIVFAIRSFFHAQGYVEVTTPVRVRCPGFDHYVDALPAGEGYFLATSPELPMKRIMCMGAQRVYQISPAFRADETGFRHSQEFSMLEWYHAGIDYLELMNETEELLRHVMTDAAVDCPGLTFPLPRLTVDDVYAHAAGWRPSEAWDEDRYFFDWVNTVEPCLETLAGVFLYDFPAALAALSVIKKTRPTLCERFELFLRGIEIGNAYTELTDYDEHVRRFAESAARRSAAGKEPYPRDERFLQALAGGLPACAGIAVGVDRLVMALTGSGHIDDVIAFPISRL